MQVSVPARSWIDLAGSLDRAGNVDHSLHTENGETRRDDLYECSRRRRATLSLSTKLFPACMLRLDMRFASEGWMKSGRLKLETDTETVLLLLIFRF